jgi:hypothetical protein
MKNVRTTSNQLTINVFTGTIQKRYGIQMDANIR